jgi:hypothetical protein
LSEPEVAVAHEVAVCLLDDAAEMNALRNSMRFSGGTSALRSIMAV